MKVTSASSVGVVPSLEGGVGVLSLSAVSKLVPPLLNGPLPLRDGLQRSTHGHVITSRTTGSRDMSGVPLPLRIPKVESDDISVGTAVADPGGGTLAHLAPKISSKSCSFQTIFRGKPLF